MADCHCWRSIIDNHICGDLCSSLSKFLILLLELLDPQLHLSQLIIVSSLCVQLYSVVFYLLGMFEVLDFKVGQLKSLVDEQNILLRDGQDDVLVLLAVQRLRVITQFAHQDVHQTSLSSDYASSSSNPFNFLTTKLILSFNLIRQLAHDRLQVIIKFFSKHLVSHIVGSLSLSLQFLDVFASQGAYVVVDQGDGFQILRV